MKPSLRRTTLTSNGRAKRRSAGSVTLEAALVMPMFLLTVLFLVFLIQTSIIAMSLHGALSQTVRQVASAWYPIALAVDEVRSTPIYQKTEEWSAKLQGIGETLAEYGEWLPSPLLEWAREAADGSWSLEQNAARAAFGQMLKRQLEGTGLAEDRLDVVNVELPDDDDAAEAFLTIEAEYRLPFKVPFVGRTLLLRESARERVWYGGSPSAARRSEAGAETGTLTFVSISPDPVTRGRKVTLRLRTEPGQQVDLTVVYKSGESQAKNLGTATADESGVVTWTWHVSGNTTPGQWSWEARSASGALLTQTFEVRAKA